MTSASANWAGSQVSQPLQNRVTPTGEIVAVPARGLLMGNRGCLHRPDRTLGTTRWRSKLWICCVLDWQGRKRDPMPPGRWTALFFLDEATALAAGHRPCGYCRRPAYLAYAEAWRAARDLAKPLHAGEMDAQLHAERVVSRSRRQRTHQAVAGSLPDGVLIRHAGEPALMLGGQVLPWSFTGYQVPVPLDPGATVEVLTPPTSVATIAAGFRPVLHPSAGAPGRASEASGGASWPPGGAS
jgi:hypothetical protein